MSRFYFFVVAAILATVGTTPRALAQTPANISVISGNGQVICPLCTSSGTALQVFDGMYVKVTDGNGNPVSGATVSWAVTSGAGLLSDAGQTDQTTTNTAGIAVDTYTAPSQITGTQNNPFFQASISAALTNGNSVTFYETQALSNTSNIGGLSGALVFVQALSPGSSPPCASCLTPGDTLTGNAGGTATQQIKFQIYAPFSAEPVVPNVSLRLISNQGSPTVSCATSAGADPGSVLTDSSGTATCTPVFGSTTGTGTFYALIGGIAAPGNNSANGPIGYYSSVNYNLRVLAGLPSSLSIISGNNQTALPGQAVPSVLIAQVGDLSGNPLSGQPVTWTVSPAGAATLSNTTATSDQNGRVQTNVTLAGSASGQVLVKVALVSNPNVSATFAVTANLQLTGLQIVSGNNQTALVNTGFGSPLVVQLTAANGVVASGEPVIFSITGPAVLSTFTATTDSTGKASVNVSAGASTGAVTVTATSGSFTQTFSLTVIPQGPTLTTGSFVNGADFQPGSLSPCSIATIIAPGIAAAIQGAVAYDGVGALPYALASDQVTFGGAQAPIYNVANLNGQQQVTVQVPCSVTPGSVPVVVNVGGGSGTINVNVLPASPGLFATQFSSTTQIPVLERSNGSFVSPSNPAQPGETLTAFVTGMGPTSPALATNSLPAPGSSPAIQGTIIVGMNGGGVQLVGSSVSSDIVGLETVSFVVPPNTPTGNSTFSIGVVPQGSGKAYYSMLGFFPVHP